MTKNIIFLSGTIAILGFNIISVNFQDTSSQTISGRILRIDTGKNPCHQFRILKTADQYFESGNNRTKGCWPNDSLTTVAAAKDFGAAVKLKPKFWQARRNFARQLLILKQYDAAIEQIDSALEIVTSETNPDLNVMRGNALYEKGQFQKAIKDFDVAMKYSGNNDSILLRKAKALWKLGQKEKACDSYQKAISLTPHLVEEKEFIVCN